MNLYDILRAKAKGMKDATLMEVLSQPKLSKHLSDWRNWTEPVFLGVAEEAFDRGLIK